MNSDKKWQSFLSYLFYCGLALKKHLKIEEHWLSRSPFYSNRKAIGQPHKLNMSHRQPIIGQKTWPRIELKGKTGCM